MESPASVSLASLALALSSRSAVCTFGGHWIPLRELRLNRSTLAGQLAKAVFFPLGLSCCRLQILGDGPALGLRTRAVVGHHPRGFPVPGQHDFGC